MNKIIIPNLEEEIYYEKLDNGLDVYIYKKEGFLKKGAYFVTKYGSATNEFIPIGEKEMVSFPKGIAHFLEHKLFESEDNEGTFKKFQKYGAFVNAYTNHDITNYYFSTNENFYECLYELITFVQNPYFTDKNVEKEKGIINQEINMTEDDIERFMYNEMFNLTLINNPNKYKTIGDKENVSRITKEDLYRCYNTFYHPSNMVLSIYGDIDVERAISLIKETVNKKQFEKEDEINIKKYDEEDFVCEKYKEITRNVANPKLAICYKIKVPNLEGEKRFKLNHFFPFLLDLKFGSTTSFEKDLVKDGVTKNGLGWNYIYFDDIVLLFFKADVINKDELIKRIDNKLKENTFDKKIFDLIKKSELTSVVRGFDNPQSVANVIYSNHIKYGKVITNIYDLCKNYSFEEFISTFNNINFDNKSILYVKAKEE